MEGKTLLRRALEAVPAACFDRVAVVTQYPRGMDLAREMGFLPVENPRPDLGLSHTIALGMAHMQDMDGVMFQVSDQPLLLRDRPPMPDWLRSTPLPRLLMVDARVDRAPEHIPGGPAELLLRDGRGWDLTAPRAELRTM